MQATLAAVCFRDGQDVDRLLGEVAIEQMARGKRVVGVLQARGDSHGECHCSDMDLETIGSGKVFRISQPLGEGSAGCRLHPGALADCSAFLQQEIEQGCDLLILNRFGKGESEGRGFRDLISSALSFDIPVLMALRSTYLDSFHSFAGELGTQLVCDRAVIDAWVSNFECVEAA